MNPANAVSKRSNETNNSLNQSFFVSPDLAAKAISLFFSPLKLVNNASYRNAVRTASILAGGALTGVLPVDQVIEPIAPAAITKAFSPQEASAQFGVNFGGRSGGNNWYFSRGPGGFAVGGNGRNRYFNLNGPNLFGPYGIANRGGFGNGYGPGYGYGGYGFVDPATALRARQAIGAWQVNNTNAYYNAINGAPTHPYVSPFPNQGYQGYQGYNGSYQSTPNYNTYQTQPTQPRYYQQEVPNQNQYQYEQQYQPQQAPAQNVPHQSQSSAGVVNSPDQVPADGQWYTIEQ